MRLLTIGLIGALIPLTLHAPEPDPLIHEKARLALSPEEARIARIRHHFDGALELLAGRSLRALNAEQRANRARLVRVLSEYRDAGAYPRNYDFPGSPTPYFVDRKTGILCAVATLMAASGRRELVDRVAAADNNVWVAELAGDAEFRAWLDEQGLTLDNDRVGSRVGALSMTMGAAGLWTSSRAATRYRMRARVSPILPIGPEQGAGLTLQLTF